MSWEVKKLNEIVIVKSGKRLPKGHDFFTEATNHPYIRARDIKNGKIKVELPVYINDDTFDKISRYVVSENDVVITIVGANVGDIAIIDTEYDGANLTENAAKLIPKDNNTLSPKFLKYALFGDVQKSKFQQIAMAAAQPKLGFYKIKDFEINLPNIQTQKRIADILSAYDDLIENNGKRIKLLEQAAQNIYKEWFVNLRFPGYENAPINEETGLPEGWCKSPFNKFSINNNRKRIPINSTERSKRQGNYRYYGATKAMDYIDDYIFDGRYLLIAEDGTVYDKEGNAFTQLVEGKFWVNNHAHIISGDCLPVEFLYLAMKHYPIGHLITGAVQLKLSMKNLSRVDIINPSEEILQAFMSIVNPMINQVFTLDMQNQKLKAARDILLPRLMNRTIEV